MALDLRAALETLSGAEGVGGLSAAPDAAEALLRPYCESVERDPLGSVMRRSCS